MAETIDIDGIEVTILRDGNSGAVSGSADANIRATMTYRCEWGDWATVWQALLGYAAPPAFLGSGSRTPHTHPYYDVLQCEGAEVYGIGEASFNEGKIEYVQAIITASYGVPPGLGGGSGLFDPPPGDIEDVTYGQIQMVHGGEYLETTRHQPYKWAEGAGDGYPIEHLITKFVPTITYTFAVENVGFRDLAHFNALKTLYGRVNDDIWNGAPAGHMHFIGMESTELKASQAKPLAMSFTVIERVEAPWNWMWSPQVNVQSPIQGGPLILGWWNEITPIPHLLGDFGIVFDDIFRP